MAIWRVKYRIRSYDAEKHADAINKKLKLERREN